MHQSSPEVNEADVELTFETIDILIIEWSDKLGFYFEEEVKNPGSFEIRSNIKQCRDKIQYYKNVKIQKQLSISNILQTALLELNYNEQENIFKDFWNKHKIGSFLIQGGKRSCQKWLIYQLIKKTFPGLYTPYKYSVNDTLTSREKIDFENLTGKLAKRIGLNENTSIQEIIERILKLLKNDSVVVVFDNLDNVYEEEQKKIIERIWNPLLEMINSSENEYDKFYLLFFLVDNKRSASTWGIDFIEYWKNRHFIEPVTGVVELPIITNFQEQTLRNWFEIQRENLPKWVCHQSDIDKIWEDTEGVPKDTMSDICAKYKCNWSDIEILIAAL